MIKSYVSDPSNAEVLKGRRHWTQMGTIFKGSLEFPSCNRAVVLW